MNYVEITDSEFWFNHFVIELAAIFLQGDEKAASEKMIVFFQKLIDQKAEELDQHFKAMHPGRYITSPAGIEIRSIIQKRHNEALAKAIRFFPEEKWINLVADMVMRLYQANELFESEKIIHELIIPMFCKEEMVVNNFKAKVLEKLNVRMYTFSEREREKVIFNSGF